ncbi:MAG: hypothetical protein N3D85_07280 [Candidatus Bathyarchaeota archaeon]|nr:hypothetical protein [Candidatus Bathyarchaeota archaeon]
MEKMVLPMDMLGDLLGFITGGTLAGIPTIVVMAIPFIVGLIVGFLVKKVLKWAIIAAVIVAVIAYFGFFGLTLDGLKNLAVTYTPMVYQYGILLFGILPLGLGFIIGLVLSFIFG